MNDDIKVYRITEYSWIATPWDLNKTVEWFESNFDNLEQEDIDDIKEVSLNDTFWIEVEWDTPLNKHIQGEKLNVIEYTQEGGGKLQLTTFGDYINNLELEIKEPFEIVSTEI